MNSLCQSQHRQEGTGKGKGGMRAHGFKPGDERGTDQLVNQIEWAGRERPYNRPAASKQNMAVRIA